MLWYHWLHFSIFKSMYTLLTKVSFVAEPLENMWKVYFRFLQRNICSVLNYTSISLIQKNKIVKSKSHRETHSISYKFQLFASEWMNEREREFLLLLLFIIVNHQHFHLDGWFLLLSPSLSLLLVIWFHFVSFHFERVHSIHIHILSIEYIYRLCVCFLSICQKAASTDDEIESSVRENPIYNFNFDFLILFDQGYMHERGRSLSKYAMCVSACSKVYDQQLQRRWRRPWRTHTHTHIESESESHFLFNRTLLMLYYYCAIACVCARRIKIVVYDYINKPFPVNLSEDEAKKTEKTHAKKWILKI